MFWDLDKVVYIMKKKAKSFQIKLKLYYISNYLHLVDADFWMEYIRPLKRKFLWSANEFNTIGLCSRYRIAFVSAAASGWCGSFYSQWMHSIDDYVHYGPFLILTTVYFPSLLSTANIFLKTRSVLYRTVIRVTLYCSVLQNTARITNR